MFCTSCGKEIGNNSIFCFFCGNKTAENSKNSIENLTSNQSLDFDFSDNSNTVINITNVRYEYKILSQKDKLFSGKFDPTNLEHAINAYAQQGWRVISCATADISGLGKKRQEFILVFEREVK